MMNIEVIQEGKSSKYKFKCFLQIPKCIEEIFNDDCCINLTEQVMSN